MNKKIVFVLILALLLVLSACSKDVPSSPNNSSNAIALSEHVLNIYYDDKSFSISAEEILAMTPVTLTVTNISSSGDIDKGEIKGVTLNSILANLKVLQQDYDEVTLSAADGYSMIVPREIVKSKDIYIIWEYKGEALTGLHFPIRAAIADERSMYWVGQLNKINLSRNEGSSSTSSNFSSESSRLVLLENAFKTLDSMNYTYYEDVDSAVSVIDLEGSFSLVGSEESTIRFIAADGFTKTESLKVFLQGYIKYTGENAPLFLAPDMPKGMHVKYIMSMDNGRGTIYLSGDKAYEYFTDRLVNIIEMDSVPLQLIEELTGLGQSTEYKLIALDGYEKIIDRALFERAALYRDQDGNFGISFEGLERRERVKDILYIEAVKGE